tara:strand:+ start:36 stop:152 length:117 start_codon:yes stop_codon:yes gene_type:complete
MHFSQRAMEATNALPSAGYTELKEVNCVLSAELQAGSP